MHGDMARPLDHHLAVRLPRYASQFAERFEFGELSLVVGVGDGAGAQAVAQRERNVVGAHDLADGAEPRVEGALLVARQTPLRHEGAAARAYAGRSPRRP